MYNVYFISLTENCPDKVSAAARKMLETLVEKEKDNFYAYSYVWNKDDEWCSEFGTVGIKSACGGIRRFC